MGHEPIEMHTLPSFTNHLPIIAVPSNQQQPQHLEIDAEHLRSVQAEISSNSWGGHSESQALQSAIQVAMEAGHLFVSWILSLAETANFPAKNLDTSEVFDQFLKHFFGFFIRKFRQWTQTSFHAADFFRIFKKPEYPMIDPPSNSDGKSQPMLFLRSRQREMTTAMQIFLPSIPASIRTCLGETGDICRSFGQHVETPRKMNKSNTLDECAKANRNGKICHLGFQYPIYGHFAR